MSASAHSSSSSPVFVQKRLRNLNSIQIRNLTPYPVRDSFAAALTRHVSQTRYTSSRHLADDLDLTFSKKRSRRISAGSVPTLQSVSSDQDVEDVFTPPNHSDFSERKRTISAKSSGTSQSPEDKQQLSSSYKRPPRRRRTSSLTSSNSTSGKKPATTLSGFVMDNSQDSLEKVVSSRLVETFLTISVSSAVGSSATPRSGLSSAASANLKVQPRTAHSSKILQPAEQHDKKRNNAHNKLPSLSITSMAKPSHSRTLSSSSTSSFHVVAGKPQPTANGTESPRLPKSPQSPDAIPAYISPIHRPSTHPRFILDPKTDFGSWVDLKATKLIVSVFGRVGDDWASSEGQSLKGKETLRQDSVPPSASEQWKLVKEWTLNLEQAVPVTSRLPSNSLILELGSTGDMYYIPDVPDKVLLPTSGYASDPEATTRDGETKPLETTPLLAGPGTPRPHTSTADWQDLFKLATLHTCIIDNQESLDEVTQKMSAVVETDTLAITKREILAREFQLSVIQAGLQQSRSTSSTLREKISALRLCINDRREMLSQAYEQHSTDMSELLSVDDEISVERRRLDSLLISISPVRTALLTTLSSIYPIELLSPPDLLYTILDVPLPIPLSSSDPAPPLSMPSHKQVNEDAIAASLGYAAQLLQLLAAYLRKTLVYPVTCVGSRSFIRDDISAMMGPRMFPLFSKGVDVYRFEYGVFLLNKNIEMLMIDRNLKALDMRHTLPNLKNLLLTLTDEDMAPSPTPRVPPRLTIPSLESSTSSLNSDPSQSTKTVATETISSQASQDAKISSTGSGSTTPIATVENKKPRSFLGLAPLSGFLSHYYPSKTSIATEPSELEEDTDSDDDAEDRRTIRGSEALENGQPPDSEVASDSANTPLDKDGATTEKVGQGEDTGANPPRTSSTVPVS